MKLFPSLPDNQHYTPLCKYRGSGTRHPGETGLWSCGQQNTNNHHSHSVMRRLSGRNIVHKVPSENNEATLYFFLGLFLLPVFPSVFAVIYNRGEQENKKYLFLFSEPKSRCNDCCVHFSGSVSLSHHSNG